MRKKNLRTKKIFSRTKDFVVSAPRNEGRTKEFWGFAPIAHQRFFRYRTNSAPSKRWLSYGRCAQGRFFLGLWVLLLFKLFKTSFFFLILRFFWMGEDLGSGCFRLVLFSWIIWRYKTERILFGALSNSLVRWTPRTKPRTKKNLSFTLQIRFQTVFRQLYGQWHHSNLTVWRASNSFSQNRIVPPNMRPFNWQRHQILSEPKNGTLYFLSHYFSTINEMYFITAMKKEFS